MPATYTLTVDDFTRLQKVVAKRFRSKTRLFSPQFALRVVVWFCIGLAAATYARLVREYPELSKPLWVVAFLLVVALVAIVAMPYVARASLRKFMLLPNGAFLSKQTVSLSSTSVQVSSSTAATMVPWSGVLAREEDDTNYYLFIDAMQALVLPRAAIASFSSEFEKYTAHLKNAA